MSKIVMVAVFACSWTVLAMAQSPSDGTAKPAEGTTKKEQCLIVAPKPIMKYEMRDSYNLAPENVKDVYKSKDLTDLRKQGVHVITIDPLGHQLEKAQEACKAGQK